MKTITSPAPKDLSKIYFSEPYPKTVAFLKVVYLTVVAAHFLLSILFFLIASI